MFLVHDKLIFHEKAQLPFTNIKQIVIKSSNYDGIQKVFILAVKYILVCLLTR